MVFATERGHGAALAQQRKAGCPPEACCRIWRGQSHAVCRLRNTSGLRAVPATAAQGNASVKVPVPAVDPTAPRATAPIGPLDRLEVMVFLGPGCPLRMRRSTRASRIMLPLAGEFSAAGKSAQMLSSRITQRLRQYLRNPEVAVRVKTAAAKRITVAGSVMEPGVFPVEGRVTLLQAIALAKGPSQVADLDTTLIFRTQNGQNPLQIRHRSNCARQGADPRSPSRRHDRGRRFGLQDSLARHSLDPALI